MLVAKKLSPQSKIDPLRDLRFVLYDNIKKFRRKKKTIKREVVWLLLHVAFSAFLPFAAKSSQRHESKVGAAKSKTFHMFFLHNQRHLHYFLPLLCLFRLVTALLR